MNHLCAVAFQQKNVLARALLLSAALVLGSAVTAVWADDRGASTRYFSIDAQPLSSALRQYADQTGEQVVFFSEIGKEQRSFPVVGTFTEEAALNTMLKNTGLSYERLNKNTIAIKRAGSKSAGAKEEDLQVALSDEPSSTATTQAASPQDPSENTKEEPAEIQEIIVTAQKREERLQDVPISISVLKGVDLDRSNLQGVSEALNRIPGVIAIADHHGGGSHIGVRGVAAGAPYAGGASTTGYYLDSVPLSGTGGSLVPDAGVYDLARIEVLRGPQGTLFGVNSVGGLVRVLTHDADPNKFDFKARTSAGTTQGGSENYRGDAAINIPIVEGKLAARAVVGYQDLSGWIDNPAKDNINDATLRTYRLKINAQPTERLSIGLTAWSSRQDYGAPSRSDDDGRLSYDRPEPMVADYDIYGLDASYEFSRFSVSSATSYIDYQTNMAINLTPFGLDTPLIVRIGDRVFTQEVLANSNDTGSWRWTMGAIYTDLKSDNWQDLVGIYLFPNRAHAQSKSYAVFGQVGRRFFDDQLEFALGGRTFRDERSSGGLGIQNQVLPNDEFTSKATTPRAILTWYPRADVTVYASYGEGFRSGAPPSPLAPQLGEVKPDKLYNYEMGAKADVLDGRLALDTSLYYMKWDDVQQLQSVPVNGLPFGLFRNSGDASGPGVDISVIARPVGGLDLGLSVSWNDLTLDQGYTTSTGIPIAKGERLNRSSEYTSGVFAEYGFPLGGTGFKGIVSASVNYSSEQLYNGTEGDALTVARASFAISSAEHWTTTVFVDNLTGEYGGPPSQEFNGTLTQWVPRIRPRTMGIQLEYGFGR